MLRRSACRIMGPAFPVRSSLECSSLFFPPSTPGWAWVSTSSNVSSRTRAAKSLSKVRREWVLWCQSVFPCMRRRILMSRLLVVDDQESVAYSTGLLLKRAGYHVDASSDAKKALELLAHGSYDLVLSDLRMEQVSGLELLKQV